MSSRVCHARSQPRNYMASCHCAFSLEYTDLTVMMHNEALYDICHRNSDIELDQLLAQFISHGPYLCVSMER